MAHTVSSPLFSLAETCEESISYECMLEIVRQAFLPCFPGGNEISTPLW